MAPGFRGRPQFGQQSGIVKTKSVSASADLSRCASVGSRVSSPSEEYSDISAPPFITSLSFILSQAENSSAESRNRVRMVDFIIIALQFEVEFHAEIGAGIAAYQCVGLVSVRRTVCEQPVYENRNVEPVAVKPFRDFEIDVHTERRETVEIGFFRYVIRITAARLSVNPRVSANSP